MTKKQISDEQLTFYYYNDGLRAAERQEIANALAVDNDLAFQYQRLCLELELLSNAKDIQPPSDMVERWHDTIRRSAEKAVAPEQKTGFHTWSFFWGFAVTAALAVGIGIGAFLSTEKFEQVPIQSTSVNNGGENSPFVRSLRIHLRDSEESLAAFAAHSPSTKADLIVNIIEQNRLFEKAAERNDEHSVARVLRAFELVLIRIAAEDTSAEDAEELREKLLFELNIMLTKLSQNTSKEQQTI